MKKNINLVLVALSVVIGLTACSSDGFEDKPIDHKDPTSIKFNLTAKHSCDTATSTRGNDDCGWQWQSWDHNDITSHASTRAVKMDWENGDVIFVFFSNVDAPKYLKMTFDGTDWESVEYDGSVATPDCLGLTEGMTGTMRAVFLPFGNDATVSADGTDFKFSETYYTYYLTATLDYEVKNGEVSGAFNMTIPDDYVQFFVEDAEATDGAYTLGIDAVIPTGVASIAADGTITETTDKTASDDMEGYAYSGGYLFSGKLNSSYDYNGYYFAMKKVSDNTRTDYFVTNENRTLGSHSAVKLPANDHTNWVAVGAGINVEVGFYGTWATCNNGASVPENPGVAYFYEQADQMGAPSQYRYDFLLTSEERVVLSIHGMKGMVYYDTDCNKFMFFPFRADRKYAYYWTSTDMNMQGTLCRMLLKMDSNNRVKYEYNRQNDLSGYLRKAY